MATDKSFEPGTQVELNEYGEWTGEAYTVTAHVGRTPEHLVLLNPKNGVLFELYNDAPYNVRPYRKQEGGEHDNNRRPGASDDAPGVG